MWGRGWVVLTRQTVKRDAFWCSSSGHKAAEVRYNAQNACLQTSTSVFLFYFYYLIFFSLIFTFECATGAHGTMVHGSAATVCEQCEGLCFWLWSQATHMHCLAAVYHGFDISSNFWHPKSMKGMAPWPQALRPELQLACGELTAALTFVRIQDSE